VLSDIKLIILDRDGVINEDSEEYIKSPEEFHPLPGSLEAIAALNRAGYTVTVATNQSGIGRGYYSLKMLENIHTKMHALLAEKGAHLDALVYCPHTPEDQCACRKPKPGLIQQLLARYPEVPPAQVLLIGDSLRDLEAAWHEKCQAVLVRTGKGLLTLDKHAEALEDVDVFADLAAVVRTLLR
jgi:D-glycero-D-manno-heptose 1,7-bisphosphate phosphatase